MDRYSRGYDERYRGYYDRPRSDTYRPNESYRAVRDYRDNGSGGSRNYSPSRHYYTGMSPSPSHSGVNPSSSRSSSGSRGSDRYPKDHWYDYPESRSHRSSHYSSGRAPSPPLRSSSSDRGRPSMYSNCYPRHAEPYPMRSPSPGSYGRRSPYHGPPSQHPGSSASTHPSGHPPPPAYRSHPPSSYPYHWPAPNESSPSAAPFTASSYSPRSHYRGPSQSSSYPSSMSSPRDGHALPRPPVNPSASTPTLEHSVSPQAKPSETILPPQHAPTTPTSGDRHPPEAPPFHKPGGPPASNSSTWPRASYSGYGYRHHHHGSFHGPVSSLSRHPSSSSTTTYGPGSSSHAHHDHHSYHHSSVVPAFLSQPPRPRLSFAPEQEKEMERRQAEIRKNVTEETKILAANRKSRFELELATWETTKLNHQLELVQRQWEESGLEKLVRDELGSKLAGIGASSSRGKLVV